MKQILIMIFVYSEVEVIFARVVSEPLSYLSHCQTFMLKPLLSDMKLIPHAVLCFYSCGQLSPLYAEPVLCKGLMTKKLATSSAYKKNSVRFLDQSLQTCAVTTELEITATEQHATSEGGTS